MNVRGTVQGVGFRPFVYRLADEHGLTGWVRNSGGPVEIEIEGPDVELDAFVHDLTLRAPPLARIEHVECTDIAPEREPSFRILESAPRPGDFLPVAPDSATCEDCLREVIDPGDRRYAYPFINCTNCGPRFTIIEGLPYDRSLTSMRGFEMCPACRAEYEDPLNRRFHAQPNACWDCGPRLSIPIEQASEALRRGDVVAVKGLGGYQLACDARDETVVRRLRERKRRPSKPFAVTLLDPERWCEVDPLEREVLAGRERPIVLLRYRGGLAPSIAPGLNELGVMLPYTPLHHLLMRAFGGPLVMTSGNLSEEPICRDDGEARERLAGIADAFLSHDRPIAARYDDSVVRVVAGRIRVIRRARGLAPDPLPLPQAPPLVATGAHLKAAFTVARDGHAFVGPHVGDLEQPLTVTALKEQLERYRRLFAVDPELVACDLHPDYASTRIAEALGEPLRVQHHHAHVASVMAEHALEGPVAGVAMDGVGLGTDRRAWGGELLACEGTAFQRLAHLEEVPLPGGDLCAREGWRMALAYGWDERPPGVPTARHDGVRRLARSGSVPVTTSMGRLFDAVAALLGICHVSSYEGEAAALLEAAVDPSVEEAIPAGLAENRRLFAELSLRRAAGEDERRLAAVFHNSVVASVLDACRQSGLRQVTLSGGCFQNRRLLAGCIEQLEAAGFDVYANERVPCNDGGISYGQAWVAACS